MVRPASLISALVTMACPLQADARPCSFYGMNPGAPVWDGTIVLDAELARAIAATGARSIRVDFRLDGAADWDEAAGRTSLPHHRGGAVVAPTARRRRS